MFVSQKPVAITEGANTISIRPKMDFGTKNACMDALAVINPEAGRNDVAMHLGAYQLALLQQNIVSWSGPDFAGVKCTPANIATLDPDEPLVVKVLEEIVRRNPLGGETDLEKKTLRTLASLPSGETGGGGRVGCVHHAGGPVQLDAGAGGCDGPGPGR